MAAKRMDLNVPTLLVFSGCSNPLGRTLCLELCSRVATGSMAFFLDENQEELQSLEQLLNEQLKAGAVEIITSVLDATNSNGGHLLEQVLRKSCSFGFQRSIIVHNEGDTATHGSMEPQSPQAWTEYVHRRLYAPVSLNQLWLNSKSLAGIEKVVINVTSSLKLCPLVYNTLLCSCKLAREMYFRSMASEERRSGVHVLSYAPGLFKTHETQYDINGNIVDPETLVGVSQIAPLPRVLPQQAALKLINILEEISFVSGHDVDFYDTYVL